MSHHGRVESAGHEANSASLPIIFISGAGIFLLIAVALILVTLNLKLLAVVQSDREPMNAPDTTNVPYRVITWAKPLDELPGVRESQLQNLSGYGWVDQPHGVVRIPIERAMELVAAGPTQPAKGAK